MSAAWSVARDPETGEPTLWHGDRSVIRRSDLRRVAPVAEEDALFGVLVRVLAPDEATIERLARMVAEYDGHNWDAAHPDEQDAYVEHVNVTLASLAGTAAQDAEVSTDG